MRRRLLAACCASALVAGCASFFAPHVEPGKSTEAQVLAEMGTPAQRVALPGGEKALYFSRLPDGRRTFLAVLSADGTLKSFDQLLDARHFARLVPGTTTEQQALELLGPPARKSHNSRRGLDVWDYPWLNNLDDRRIDWLYFSGGVLREAVEMHDFDTDPPSLSD